MVPSALRTGVPSTRSLAIKLCSSQDVASVCIIAYHPALRQPNAMLVRAMGSTAQQSHGCAPAKRKISGGCFANRWRIAPTGRNA